MDSAEDIQHLAKQGLKVLINELVLQRRHLSMVREQNKALVACNRKMFASLHDEYTELLGELSTQNKLRIAVFGTQTVEQAIKEWPEIDRRNAMKVAADLKLVVPEVQRINRQNEKLIGSQLRYFDFMMNVLVRTYRKGCTYGPQGSQSINRGNLFFNSAA